MKLEVEIISDVICPWCFIGKRRFESALRRLPGVETQVRWLPFQLNPAMPPGGMERRLYRTRKFGSWEQSKALDAQLVLAGAGERIAFAFDRIERTPNTFDAHRLIWLAGEQGIQDAIVEALFQAYFVEARDIGDRNVLRAVAAGAGLETAGFFESGRGAREVQAEESWARSEGIQGVPLFVINGTEVISGAQNPETIAVALNRAARTVAR
ncbi:MAG TPA: DsbA family oxidoreductase [Bryobacteraceae bacterium]|jgi:predicted DsbA family dithiol-disulfide isomerase|nr:DsbA family oxidoreductase [Bryobacteraceae bacterium]